MSFKYDKAFRATHNPTERIELNSNGTALKKYGASPTSWPEYNSIQFQGLGHKHLSKTPYGFTNKNANLDQYGNSMNNLFK